MNAAILFFVNTIVITLLSSFFIGIKGNSIKRTFRNIPLYIVYKSIVTNSDDVNYDFKINVESFKENVKEYLSIAFKNRINNYKISFTPYETINENDYENYFIDLSENVSNIQVDFESEYLPSFVVKDTVRFTAKTLGIFKE